MPLLGTRDVMADLPSRRTAWGPSGLYTAVCVRVRVCARGSQVCPVPHAPARLKTHIDAISNSFIIKSSNHVHIRMSNHFVFRRRCTAELGRVWSPKRSALVHGVCLREKKKEKKKGVSVACLKSATEGRLCCESRKYQNIYILFLLFFFLLLSFTGKFTAVQSKCN